MKKVERFDLEHCVRHHRVTFDNSDAIACQSKLNHLSNGAKKFFHALSKIEKCGL